MSSVRQLRGGGEKSEDEGMKTPKLIKHYILK